MQVQVQSAECKVQSAGAGVLLMGGGLRHEVRGGHGVTAAGREQAARRVRARQGKVR
jgi:hypothetical protein